ncbi:MAG: C40 family peptidase [Lachnospiraceae bacterium]|nr:C40 family peptidase [Lachnospiraceae bacterium]
MKNNISKEYVKYIALGTAGFLLITGMALKGDSKKEERQNIGKVSVESNVTMPSAGIAILFDGESHSGTKMVEKSDEFSSGINNVLKEYYIEEDDDTLTIENIEKVMKFLPEETKNAENTEAVKNDDDSSDEVQTEEAMQVVDGYTNLGVANVTNYLNVRETPDTDGELLGKLPMNAGCEILETLDGWYKISSGNVEGYVSSEFLLTGEAANERALQEIAKVAHVDADMLMVREEMNTECKILTCVAEDEELEVVEELNGWVKVNIDDVTGYVCADYVTIYQTLPKGVTLKELSYGEGVSNTAVDLIEYAKQFLGNPYVYGGTSLTNGTDCSGFTMRVFEHFGYSLSRTSREQAYNGTRVSLSEIQPGDLLFYSHGGTIGHVAIYIGDGQIIHASTERTGIIIGNAFYTTPTCAVRIIN